MVKNPILTSTQVADMLGISRTTIQLLMDEGVIASWKTLGGHRRTRQSFVENWYRTQTHWPSFNEQALPELQIHSEYLPACSATYPLPDDEAERLMAVQASNMANARPDADMARIARLASLATNSPIALVSILSSTIQWCKASIGLPIVQAKRGWSFCTHTILQSAPFIVEDARIDARFSKSPWVLTPFELCFYAGVALHDSDGMAIGTLCVMDREPRKLRAGERDALVDLAAMASAHFASDEPT